MKKLFSFILILIINSGLQAQFGEIPEIKLLGRSMTNDERSVLNDNSNKTGVLFLTGYSARNNEFYGKANIITHLEVIVKKGKLYGKKYNAYYGEVPFCLKVINNSYGEPWGIDFSCPDDKLVKEIRAKGSYNEFHSPTYIYDNKYIIEKGSSGIKKSDCFSIKISLTNSAIRGYVIYAKSQGVIEEVNNRTFDSKIHTVKNSEELFYLISPKGNNLYKVAGSRDPELKRFYKGFDIVGDSYYKSTDRFYPEWTYEQYNNNGGGTIKKVMVTNLGYSGQVYLSLYKGLILELNNFDEILAVDKGERNLDVIIPELFKDKKVKQLRYMEFRNNNFRITAEIETEFGLRYLDIIKFAGNEPLVYKIYLHDNKPDNFEDNKIWTNLKPMDRPWE